eukprot:m51a1_g3037 putative nucleolar complex protein (710) ;mRNA; r:915817-918255
MGFQKRRIARRRGDEPEAPRVRRALPEKLQPLDPEAKPEERLRRFEKGRALVAQLATGLLECGEEWRSFEELTMLHDLCADDDPRIRVLAVLSEMAVFVDILPEYKIEKPADVAPGVTLSKVVLQQRAYESSLVAAYHRFLLHLKTVLVETSRAYKKMGRPKTTEDARKRELVEAEEFAAARAVARLLAAKPLFNFRTNLIDLVVPRMNSGRVKVAEECCERVVELFQADRHGGVSLEVVRRISKMLKTCSFAANPRVLETFLELDVADADVQINPFAPGSGLAEEEAAPKKGKDEGPHVSKSKRKLDKAERIIEGEFKEAEATVSRKERKKMQCAILDSVFATYFRVIKRAGATSPLLPVALRGVARHAHQINVDFMADIMRAIEDVMQQSAALGHVGSAFHCALAAFTALKTQGYCVDVDVKDFYTAVYAALWELAANPSGPLDPQPGVRGRDQRTRANAVESAMQALELMLVDQKQIPADRVAAFCKRLCSAALCQPPHVVAAFLSLLVSLFNRFPKTRQMLSSEQLSGVGQYAPDLDEPDHCNAWASVLWELDVLMNHYHPGVRKLVGQILGGTEPPALRGSVPHELLKHLRSDAAWSGVSLPPTPPQQPFRKRKGPLPESAIVAAARELELAQPSFASEFREVEVLSRVSRLQARRVRMQMALNKYQRLRDARKEQEQKKKPMPVNGAAKKKKAKASKNTPTSA